MLWTPGAAGSPAEEPLRCSRFIVAVGHNAVGRWKTKRVGLEWPNRCPCASSRLGCGGIMGRENAERVLSACFNWDRAPRPSSCSCVVLLTWIVG